jgi:isocitrate dehydrogenase (NAD+)
MLAAAMMLDHVDMKDKGDLLRKSIDDTLNLDKVRTGDLGGSANTKAFTEALVARIRNA